MTIEKYCCVIFFQLMHEILIQKQILVFFFFFVKIIMSLNFSLKSSIIEFYVIIRVVIVSFHILGCKL
jgi:hypothetical protein